MQQEAVKMILAMAAIAILVTVLSGSSLPILVVGAAAYMLWHAAKGLDG